MVENIILLPQAVVDISETRDWYEAHKEGLGLEFIESVQSCLDRIRQQPEMYALSYKNYRRAKVRRFPYVVFYKFAEDTVFVYSVFHCSRSSRSCRRRLP